LCDRPSHIPRTRPRGAPGKGISFERAFGRHAAGLFSSRRLFADQWITFFDDHGQGFANLDGFVVGEGGLVLWECKLTQQPEAFAQMEQRYVPLLSALYPNVPLSTLQVCRNLVEHPAHPADIEELFWAPRPGVRLTQHWRK